MDVQKFLEPTVNVERLVEILDGLGHEGRIHTTRTWSKKEMSRIFDAVKGHRPIDVDYVVPISEPLVEVQHDLHNALGLPGKFQKRFAKIAGDPSVVVGFNVQPYTAFAGPGYFTASKGEGEHEGELVIEYTKIPKEKPEGWPKIVENAGLIPGIVYGGMTDYLRGISTHVSIGKAFKGGKPRGEWFALVRRD
ncbi:MAG: hypothetical protein KIT84_24945 [Labilithrix sp.]|nr:hypothetical protein [Labilithrix sp.]MCW5814298.1 hypothetical protein [Labilithrix sp.]